MRTSYALQKRPSRKHLHGPSVPSTTTAVAETSSAAASMHGGIRSVAEVPKTVSRKILSWASLSLLLFFLTSAMLSPDFLLTSVQMR